MTPTHTRFRHAAALILLVIALVPVLGACGSSSAGSSSGSAPPGTARTAAPAPAAEAPEGAKELEAELAGIMRIKIYGKFGGTRTEFDVAGGPCRILKINTSPADVHAGGGAVLDHEGTASVLVRAKGGKGRTASTRECREAVESAIG
jgi:hypothetical protein